MKKALTIGMLYICSIFSLHASLHQKCTGNTIDLAQKFYVQKDNIYFNEDKIYVNFSEDLFL